MAEAEAAVGSPQESHVVRAWELLDKVKALGKIKRRIGELDAKIRDAERYDPSTARELREFRREFDGEARVLNAELQAEYARLSGGRRR